MVKTLLTVGIIGILVGAAVLALYFFLPKQMAVKLPFSPSNTPTTEAPIFSGTLTKLNENLRLVSITDYEKTNDIIPTITYYSAGTYQNTPYQGYTRYLAIRGSVDPSGPATFLFASKDQQSFVLDGTPVNLASLSDTDDPTNPVRELDKSKIVKIDHLPSAHPQVVSLTATFSLFKDALTIVNKPQATKDQYGNTVMDEVLETDLGMLTKLTPFTPSLQFFAIPKKPNAFYDQMAPSDKAMETTKISFLDTTTKVVVTDSTNLPISYDLATPKAISAYTPALTSYTQAMANYQAAVKKNPNDSPGNYPISPSLPNTRMSRSAGEIATSASTFELYDVAFPPGCSLDVNTAVVKSVSDSDLTKMGDSLLGPIYALTDKNHPLYLLQYTIKTGDKEGWKYTNKGPIPTFSEYVAKNPLLFFKDPWGRWAVVGEYDYKLAGGCGKPVLYLYPVAPTKVSVSFAKPIDLTVAIPAYHNGWKVLALPSGHLTDLQPSYTPCEELATTHVGSEYALEACKSNNYPYLYWAGNSFGSEYPSPTTGWIVGRDELPGFMGDTLSQIGLSESEQRDMLSYWLPRMQNANAPYYKIAFLQTAQMNAIAPLVITPKVDSLYRIFLDYLPLMEKPLLQLSPQKLTKIERSGFTVVEWGGLLR